MALYRLLQARNADDPVKQEELRSFAARLGVAPSSVVTHDLLTESHDIGRITDGVNAVLIGGSGHYGVLDDPDWIRSFIDLTGTLADQQFPTFASCFGFQAMVVALGGEVITDEDNAEVGTYALHLTEEAKADPLFGALPETFEAQLGHKDRSARLPTSVVHLASSERCPHQAMRVGEHVYATQFHPELTGDENRARFMRYLDHYQKVFGSDAAQEILARFRHTPHADGLLAHFHKIVRSQS